VVRAFCEVEYGESIYKNKRTHVNTKRIENHFHKKTSKKVSNLYNIDIDLYPLFL